MTGLAERRFNQGTSLLGKLAIAAVRPSHIDKVLTRVTDAGAATLAEPRRADDAGQGHA